MAEDTRALPRHGSTGTQLFIPGALVLMPTSDSGTPVADRFGWQRAILRSGLPRAAKLVALAFASHAVDVPASRSDGATLPGPLAVCAPGLVTLAAETGYSRTHVQRQVRLLRSLGWLIGVSRPAARRPASFALSMSDSVRAAETGQVSRAGSAQAATGRLRGAGSRVSSDRPTAAARRRSRITGAAVAKALTVAGDFSVVAAASAPAAVPPAATVPATARAAPANQTFPAGPSSESVQPIEPVQPAGTGPAGSGRTVHPVAEAVEQVVGTLARAMRRDPRTLGAARDRLTRILTDGSWNAAELAMHLVDSVGPSLGASRVDDPADHLLRRLDHLPASSSECLCRSCRSWVPAPAVATGHRVGPTVSAAAAKPAPVGLPELAAIEQAAAAGAAQARTRPERTTGAA